MRKVFGAKAGCLPQEPLFHQAGLRPAQTCGWGIPASERLAGYFLRVFAWRIRLDPGDLMAMGHCYLLEVEAHEPVWSFFGFGFFDVHRGTL